VPAFLFPHGCLPLIKQCLAGSGNTAATQQIHLQVLLLLKLWHKQGHHIATGQMKPKHNDKTAGTEAAIITLT
jgi:hypothetical protein